MGLAIRQQNTQKCIGLKESWACQNAKELKEITDFMHNHSIRYQIDYPSHKTISDNTPKPVYDTKDYLQISIEEQINFDTWEALEEVFDKLLSFKKKYGELPWHSI